MTYIDEHEFDNERLVHVVGLDGLAASLIVANNRLREGNAQILDSHLVRLVAGSDATQMRTQILERLEVVVGEAMQELLDAQQPYGMVIDLGDLDKLRVVL